MFGKTENLFKCKSEDGDFLVGDRVEKSINNFTGKSRLLVVVHLDHTLPISRRLHKVVPLTDVHLSSIEIQNLS